MNVKSDNYIKNLSSNQKKNTTVRERDSDRPYMNYNHEVGWKLLLNNKRNTLLNKDLRKH